VLSSQNPDGGGERLPGRRASDSDVFSAQPALQTRSDREQRTTSARQGRLVFLQQGRGWENRWRGSWDPSHRRCRCREWSWGHAPRWVCVAPHRAVRVDVRQTPL